MRVLGGIGVGVVLAVHRNPLADTDAGRDPQHGGETPSSCGGERECAM